MSYINKLQPTATRCLSCYVIIWTTQYNTPRSFRLASYSEVLHDSVEDDASPRTDRTASKPLAANLGQEHYPFSYRLTGWFVVRSAPPVTLQWLTFPREAGRLSHRSFHYTSVLVSSNRFLNEACLTTPSRLALVDQKWRTIPGAGL